MVNGRHAAFMEKLAHVFRPLREARPGASSGEQGEETGVGRMPSYPMPVTREYYNVGTAYRQSSQFVDGGSLLRAKGDGSPERRRRPKTRPAVGKASRP
jgi:hypothetical protein